MEKQIPQQKRVDVSELRYIHAIWLRERDLSAFFADGKKYRLRRHGSRRPTVRRTVGTDLSNPSQILLMKQKHRHVAVFLFHGTLHQKRYFAFLCYRGHFLIHKPEVKRMTPGLFHFLR
jgi:hypothetical protein